jgi:O-antigen biosynthesis protein
VTAIPASVVVVSRHRADELVRCLRGLAQSDHPLMELVVVADPAGIAAARECGVAPLKLVTFDQPNISAARNLGIAQAAGEIIAFTDDDAVPEPNWLSRLLAPFADPEVAIAGGFVRGRNGISFQWQARTVDQTGVAHAMEVAQETSLHRATPAQAIKTEGTNMAVRRTVLETLGGFDQGFRFYLDETDLNMRAAAAGLVTAIVPMAQVHHGFAASARRRADRAPLDLGDIGASSMRFLRKHADPIRHGAALAQLRQEQSARVVGLTQSGHLQPAEAAALIRGLEAGIERGAVEPLADAAPVPAAPPFLPLAGTGPRQWVLLAGWWRQRHRLRRDAREAAAAGKLVQLMLFSLNARPHRMQFHPEGYWEQAGGLLGRSDRSGPRLRLFTLHSRVQAECARLASVRDLGPPGG